MTRLTIHNFEEGLKSRLRLRAVIHGRSMEEAQAILRRALARDPQDAKAFASTVHALFDPRRAELTEAPAHPPDPGPS
jgi:antitoxin FitA